MATVSSIVFQGSQRNPTVVISGSGFGTAPASPATPAGSGATGSNYGMSLFISDQTQNLSAGLANSSTYNSIGLVNLSYSDTQVSFQLGSAYSLFLYNIKPGDQIGVDVNGATLNTTTTFNPAITTLTVGTARFFDTNNGTHFFTSSAAEVQQVLQTRPDLKEEGGSFNAIDPTSTDANAAPVYRFFDTHYGTHFYTSSAVEKADITNARPDLKYEGVAFNEHITQQTGDVPVYRFFDTQYGTHFYTSSATENASILATRTDLKSEGIAFYSPT